MQAIEHLGTYRNRHHVKRNYECTNVIACRAIANPDPDKWVRDDCVNVDTLTQLWIENGVRYYGHL